MYAESDDCVIPSCNRMPGYRYRIASIRWMIHDVDGSATAFASERRYLPIGPGELRRGMKGPVVQADLLILIWALNCKIQWFSYLGGSRSIKEGCHWNIRIDATGE